MKKKKIGIVTYVKCDNYGAELQAYAMQYIFNKIGYDAEVLDLEKQQKDLAKSPSTIFPAIINRFKTYGLIKGIIKIFELIIDVIKRKKANKKYSEEIKNKHLLFSNFFDNKIKHSSEYYSLKSVYSKPMEYDIFIAGSDQIWNYMHTDYLDVYFLKFANRFNTPKISYAASISVPDIPKHLREKYKSLFENIDSIGVREINGKKIVEKYSNKKATVVLDPTLMLEKEEWKSNVAKEIIKDEKYVLIYTLSRSKNIRDLAKRIAKELNNIKVINIKSDFIDEEEDGIDHLYQVGPEEWVGLIMNASYMVTDSFHGTAFSINFNIPFTTLLNPSSNMNSRALSILEITNLKDRIIYENNANLMPQSLSVDYDKVNNIIKEWRNISWNYIYSALEKSNR